MMNSKCIDEFICLSDIAEINPPRKSALKIEGDTEVSFISMSDTTESGRWLSKQTRPYREVRQGYTSFAEGDVLFAKITPCTENGKGCLAVGLKNGVGYGSTEFHVLRASKDGDNGFIFQWSIAKPLRQKAAASMTGSAGQQRVPASFFSQYKIPKIPKTEQTQIAAILSTIDRAIEQTEAIIAKQQRIKTGLMQDLLTKGIDEDGNVRSEATHAFKDSPLGRIPVEWEVEVFGNRVKSSAFGPRFPSTAYSEKGSFAVLRTTDLDPEGKISYEQMPLTNLPEKEFEKHILESGDLLITRSGTCGVPAVFGSFDVPTIPGAFLIRFRLNEDSIKPRYAHIYFNWDIGRKRLLDLAEGGVQKNLRGSTINQMLFVFPNIKEQERIIERFNAVEFEKNLILEHLKKLNSLKTGLMQDLLTGNVRVTAYTQ